MSGVQGMAALSPIHRCKVGSATSGLPCCRGTKPKVNKGRRPSVGVCSEQTVSDLRSNPVDDL